MSKKPSNSSHLRLEEPERSSFETTPSLVAKRMQHVRLVAFDHALRVRHSEPLAHEVSQAIAAKFLPMLAADAAFLDDEQYRIAYTQAAVANWFLDLWDHEEVEERYEGRVGAELEMDRSNEADAPSEEQQIAQ